MPWRLKFCQPLSGVFGAYTLRARHRAKFDVGFFISPYHHRNPIRGPPKQPLVRNTMDEQEKQHSTSRYKRSIMAPNEEQTMILKARMGDGIAFGKLYQANVARIYAIVASHTKNKDDIDDLVQIAFIKAYQGLNRFRGDATFSTWLTRIAMNVCLSHCESQSVRRKWATYFHSPEGIEKVAPRYTQDPETTLHVRECQHLVRRSIQTLPQQYREAMRLRYVEDYSYAEIEKAMQVPIGTVKTWLYRGKVLLRETMETHYLI